MLWLYILIGVIAFLTIGGVVAMLCITLPIAKRVYREQLVKETPEKWLRECSAPEHEEQAYMWKTGCEWAEGKKDYMREVMIEREGLKLYGEFYQFGGNECVIIVPGRCECLKYSYYFAEPYEKLGMNVFVFDQRAHGKSDGEYNTIGGKEHGDLIAWVQYLEKEFAIDSVWLHTICVGTSSAMLAMVSEACPKSVKGLITEGCFISFRETFKQHMIDIKKPCFPVLDEVMWYIKRYTGTNVYKTAPGCLVTQIKQPVLFLYGEKDIFSRPEKSKILFEKCASPQKELVWFKKGSHSHLRQNNLEQYDTAIAEFVNRNRK